MKIKMYKFIRKHFILSDSDSIINGISNVSFGISQKYSKRITRGLVCSLVTLTYSSFKAQDKATEPYPKTNLIVSLYGKERNDFSKNIQQSIRLNSSEFRSQSSKGVLADRDYFSADLFLENNYNTNALRGHTTQVHQYDNQDITFDGQVYDHLTVYEIRDQFTLRDKVTNGDYYYDNTYYLFRDTKGNSIGTVYYVDRTVGFLKSEYKIVNKGKTLATFPLIVAPNPASHLINVTYQVEKQGQASLQIIDMNGRIVDAIFNDKQIESGPHTVQHSINLPAGNYLIQFNAQGQAPVTQKLIIK